LVGTDRPMSFRLGYFLSLLCLGLWMAMLWNLIFYRGKPNVGS
jgi:hypothetical protein